MLMLHQSRMFLIGLLTLLLSFTLKLESVLSAEVWHYISGTTYYDLAMRANGSSFSVDLYVDGKGEPVTGGTINFSYDGDRQNYLQQNNELAINSNNYSTSYPIPASPGFPGQALVGTITFVVVAGLWDTNSDFKVISATLTRTGGFISNTVRPYGTDVYPPNTDPVCRVDC